MIISCMPTMLNLHKYSSKGVFLLCLVMGYAMCIPHSTSRRDLEDFQNETYIATENVCAELPDGAYPDYTQACRMFFICSGGQKAATFWCTKGYVFSFTTGHCEPPDGARCPDPNNPSILNRVFGLHKSGGSNECPLGDGVFPNYSDGCSTFYFCKAGIKSAFKCPRSLKFDWRTKSCRNGNDVFCNSLTCVDKENGVYIDSGSYCKRYFNCISGNISEYICPEGTIYNARQHRCTRSSVTRCHGLESTQCAGLPDGFYPDFAADCKIFGLCMEGSLKTYNCPPNTLFHIKTLTCETDAYCPKPEINKCIGKVNGIHADFLSGCRDFYICLDGLLTHQGSCPQGKILNPKNGECQLPSLVSCSEIIDTDCEGLADGVYPDYDSGCSAFFVCLGNRKISTSFCPGTDLYDIASRRCLPSSFVLCRIKTSVASPPRLFDSYNCDNRLGIFPEFSSDCQRYATCAYGHKQYFVCPEGFSFDPQSESCQKGISNCKAPFAVATFQCLPVDDGIYVGANCTQWHECRNGIGFTNVCPEGLFYDFKLGKCSSGKQICNKSYLIYKRLFRSTDVLPLTIRQADICPPRMIGIFEDPVSCKDFHFCIDGMQTSYTCPVNFSFKKEENKCGWADKNNTCENSELQQTESTPNIFSCAFLKDGMYADFNLDCRRYFVCENGDAIPVYCPERQKFNVLKMMCEREEFVSCSDVPKSSKDRTTSKNTKYLDNTYYGNRDEELYTETEGYFYGDETTKTPDEKTQRYDTYDILEEDISRAKQLNDGILRSKAPNLVIVDENSKKNSINYNPNLKETPNEKTNDLTTIPYQERTKYSNDSTPEKIHAKMHNREFDAACRKGDTGFYPDYESGCKMFHICFRSIRKIYSCPSVLLFNPETKNCDLPENVVCSRPEPILESSFDCKDKMNEFLPDFESNCKYYVGCMNNMPYKFACPKGKIFSFETSVCEYETSYKCQYPEIANSTLFDSNNDDNGKSPSYRHVHGIPGQFYFSCSDKKDGFYPDFTRHCHVFYRCVRGKKYSHYCKQGLLFNPESGICDFEENVYCTPPNRTISVS